MVDETGRDSGVPSATTSTSDPSPGWYADPSGEPCWRWWDGTAWTGWVSPSAAPTGQVAYPPAQPGSYRPGYGTQWANTGPYQALPAPPERPKADPPAAAVPRAQRRRLLAELLIVLAVFPLPYTISALVALVAAALGKGSGNRTPVLIGGHALASFPFELILILVPFAAAALASYLLSVPGPYYKEWEEKQKPRGEGGLRAIGLDFTRWRGDLALILAVFVLCELIPIYGGSILLHDIGVRSISPGSGGPGYYVVLDVVNGITSGIVEEIVVLGYLVRRLEQLNLPSFAVVAVAVVVRGSYHLYYGWGVLPILLWATVSVVLYRKYRRLLPFIIVHVVWDSSLFVASALSTRAGGAFIVIEAVVLIPVSIVMFWLWRNQIPLPNTAQR